MLKLLYSVCKNMLLHFSTNVNLTLSKVKITISCVIPAFSNNYVFTFLEMYNLHLIKCNVKRVHNSKIIISYVRCTFVDVLFLYIWKCLIICSLPNVILKFLKATRNYATVPGNGNQIKMPILATKHFIGSRQQLLQTVARKVA